MPIQHTRLLISRKSTLLLVRSISKYLHKDISAKVVRQKFLNYFLKEEDHKFVRSSPVVPYCDPTVPFVNAGMNQFKSIFLGLQTPQYPRVANSQKCIRIGGKHNDLSAVGKDGYHHTFFEMLGNWSFGDYFKKEACEMAWEVLTKVYSLPASRLYVTYFGGNEKLQLKEDVETKEIWRSLGVAPERILPFGPTENFWEMGLTGPCGPCTEIHYDHRGEQNRAELVNRGLHDLTEIWNIVFIQFNRYQDGTIKTLPKKHIDTGMGFERLVCALQGKTSSYDTDNFRYLTNAIHKNCSNIPEYGGKFGESDWNDIDMSYRIMADHIRMITIALADGVIPEENQKLRRIMRKCFLLNETVFNNHVGLVKELTNYVVDNLGPTYPELERNIKQIHQIIDYEDEVYNHNKKSAEKDWSKLLSENPKLQEIEISEITPNFIAAYKELKTATYDTINDKLAFKLYDTYGLDEYQIGQLSNILQKKFSPEDFTRGLQDAKDNSKKNSINSTVINLADQKIPPTDDSFKYIYDRTDDSYVFPEVKCRVLKILQNNQEVLEAPKDTMCSLILDKTNLYTEAGGQESDKGVIIFDNTEFHVQETEKLNDIIIHKGFTRNGSVKIESGGVVTIKKDNRIANMQNHTSTHLLNAAVKKIKQATCQKSSKVNGFYLNLDVVIFGSKLDITDVMKVEEEVQSVIEKKIDVKVSNVNSQELYNFDEVTLIPGEIYPENDIRIVEVQDSSNFISREPCCGTHVRNTADIEDFCIVAMKSLGRSTQSIFAVTGERATLARKNEQQMTEEITELKNCLADNRNKTEALDSIVSGLKQRLQFHAKDETIVPLVFKHYALEELDAINTQLKGTSRDQLKMFIEMEMQDALKSNVNVTKSKKKYIIHYLRSSMMLESVSLSKATKMCPDMPVLLIAYSDNVVKARCCVPKEYQNSDFNAEKWLSETVGTVFDSKVAPPKGQDGAEVCNMKAKKIHATEWDTLLTRGLKVAKKYVNERL